MAGYNCSYSPTETFYKSEIWTKKFKKNNKKKIVFQTKFGHFSVDYEFWLENKIFFNLSTFLDINLTENWWGTNIFGFFEIIGLAINE